MNDIANSRNSRIIRIRPGTHLVEVGLCSSGPWLPGAVVEVVVGANVGVAVDAVVAVVGGARNGKRMFGSSRLSAWRLRERRLFFSFPN